jgi:hypothetical protein
VLALGRRFAHHASEATDFVFAQSPLSAPDGKLPDALGGVPANDAKTSSMAEQRP